MFYLLEQFMMYCRAVCFHDGDMAECAVNNRIQGIGLSIKDPDRLDQTKWRGQNLLGYTLMIVGNRILAESQIL